MIISVPAVLTNGVAHTSSEQSVWHWVSDDDDDNDITPRTVLWCCRHDKAIMRVCLVDLMSVKQCEASVDPQTEPKVR